MSSALASPHQSFLNLSLDTSGPSTVSVTETNTPDLSPGAIFSDNLGDTSDGDVTIPPNLLTGTPFMKVTANKVQQRSFTLDLNKRSIEWESKRHGIVHIENIREIRLGSDARSFLNQFSLPPSLESRWITIIYTSLSKWKTLHMVALSEASFKLWSQVLVTLFEKIKDGVGNLERNNQTWMKQAWKQAEGADGKKLDFEAVRSMCVKLSIAVSRKELENRFKDADNEGAGFLSFSDFQKFVKALKTRNDVIHLFDQLCPGGEMNKASFLQFLQVEQKSKLKASELERIFSKFSNPAKGTIAVDTFTSFLLSAENSVLSDQTHDMTRPLCEYFISSSHNTYLLGDQWKSESSNEGYIRALLQGCRSVEIDCYDGEHEPIVYHGRTFTSRIPLRDVLHAIYKYAFVSSPYPIIISAEVHCSVEQQKKMASLFVEVFGEKLIIEGHGLEYLDPICGKLPSPELLKYKILLKAKTPVSYPEQVLASPSPEQAASSTEFSTDTADTESTSEAELSTSSSFLQKISRRVSFKGRKSLDQDLPPAALPLSPSPSPTLHQSSPKHEIAPELVKLVVHTIGVKFRGLNKKEVYAPQHVVSLSERTANKLLKHNLEDIVKHNRTHLMRVYPNATRISSTNFDPQKYWVAGVQLVALNWQSCDFSFLMNGAMFLRNGRSGYVLKPEPLRMKPKEKLFAPQHYVLKIKVISAQQLPTPTDPSSPMHKERELRVDPLVEITVFPPNTNNLSNSTSSFLQPMISPPPSARVSIDRDKYRRQTKAVEDNGFNPQWNEDFTIPFDCPSDMLDLAFVKFEVKYKRGADDAAVAAYCISVGSMNQGYRHLPLVDAQLNQFLFSSLFVHVNLTPAD